jgi:hypothetical protein
VCQTSEILQPGVTDPGVIQVQRSELSQRRHVFQANIADLGAVEAQPFEFGQSLEVFQPGVANIGTIKVQLPEFGQSLEVFQSGITDPGTIEVQRSEQVKSFEVDQCRVGYLCTLKTGNHRITGTKSVIEYLATQLLDCCDRLYLVSIRLCRPAGNGSKRQAQYQHTCDAVHGFTIPMNVSAAWWFRQYSGRT